MISDLDCHSRGSRLEKGRDYEHPKSPTDSVGRFVHTRQRAGAEHHGNNRRVGSGAALPNATTKIKEAVTLQFCAEFFNLPNHPNFGNPAANVSVPSIVVSIFGAGDLRQIQFGLKVLF